MGKMKGEIMEDNKLCGEFSAKVWAEEFVRSVKIKPEIATDEGTMLGWFANAIMAGYDKVNQEKAGSIEVGVEELETIIGCSELGQSAKSFCEHHKDWIKETKQLTQAILNKLKEKE